MMRMIRLRANIWMEFMTIQIVVMSGWTPDLGSAKHPARRCVNLWSGKLYTYAQLWFASGYINAISLVIGMTDPHLTRFQVLHQARYEWMGWSR